MNKIKFWLATALIKKMTLLAQCALLGRSINYLHSFNKDHNFCVNTLCDVKGGGRGVQKLAS